MARYAQIIFLSVGALFAAAAFPAPHAADPAEAPALENSVVKIFSTMRYPDPFKPWTKQAPSEATASGVVIEGKRILTNAHAVLYASQVQIQANAAGDKLSASVLAIAPGIDLAVLQLDDPSFFDTHPPVARASKLPQIKDPVLAYGFPTGGSSLSITKGIVSRIEFASYNYPVSGLRIQIDAAINPGNSGGPAIAGDKMIGLAFSRLGGDSQNIGYIIPNEEVDLFLKDIASGHYVGKASMHDDLQTLENPALREYLKLDKSVEGMVVHRPDKSDASYPLKEWDVLTRIGDTPIDNQGMVKIDKDLRVNFNYMIQKVAKDGKLPLTVVRAGKTLKIELPGLGGVSDAGVRPAWRISVVLRLRTDGIFARDPAVLGRVRKQRQLDARLELREKSAGHPRLRSAQRRSARAGDHFLAISFRTSSRTAIRIPQARWCTR